VPMDPVRQIVFIHVPKTGGTSIEQLLGLDRPECLWSPSPLDGLQPVNRTPQHYTWGELLPHLPPGLAARAFKFAFVRNPWDRFLSEYMWRRSWYFNRPRSGSYYGTRHLESLDAFVRALDLVPEERTHATRGFDAHLEPQRSFLVGEDGALAMDFVGRFETFAADVGRVCRRLEVDAHALPHAMAGPPRSGYRGHYSSQARSAVARFYREDIEAFDYSF
jgi:hypothetical protein